MFARRTVCRLSYLTVLLAGMYSAETLRAADDMKGADLKYYRDTGWVIIDPTNTPTNRTISFELRSSSPTMTPISLERLAEIFQGGIAGENTSSSIGFIDVSFFGTEGPLDLGPVFPTGLEPDDLACYLTRARSAWQLARGGDMDLYVDGFPDPVTTNDCIPGGQGGSGGEGIRMALMIYDPRTGNVALHSGDASDNRIVSFELQTSDGQGMIPVSEDRLAALGEMHSEIINEPGHIRLSGMSTEGGPLDLGPIFSAGLTWDQIADDLVIARFTSSGGQEGELTIAAFPIPEPSAGVLICLGIAAMLSRMRLVGRGGTPRKSRMA